MGIPHIVQTHMCTKVLYKQPFAKKTAFFMKDVLVLKMVIITNLGQRQKLA